MAASEVINDSLYSVDTVLKAASITSELCSSTEGAKQKPNLAMKHRHQFLFLCLFCCTFTFMIPFTTSRSFLFEGWFEMLPSLSTIHLACHLARAYTMGIRLLSSLPWILLFSLFAQILLQGKSLFLGKAMPSISRGLMKALRCLSRNLCHWCNFSCVLRFYSFVISLLYKKHTYNFFNTVTFILGMLCFVPYPFKWYWSILYSQ